MSVVAKRQGGIQVPLGTEVGIGPGHIVLGGNPAPLTEWDTAEQPPPLFGSPNQGHRKS